MERKLNRENITSAIEEYESSIAEIGGILSGLRGVELFQCLKRKQLGTGPYPHVTLFEAANRIMTDLVILKGVKCLLESERFPFNEYVVEYGNEDSNDHDIQAEISGLLFHGEAFNVAPSFFQGKKTSMLKKLRSSERHADFKMIIANLDAVQENYSPKVTDGEFYLFVDILSNDYRLLPNKANSADAKKRRG